MMNISRSFVCTNNSRNTLAHMNEMKHLPWSIPKSYARLLCINWNKTAFQIHLFLPVFQSSCQVCEKKSPVANPKGSRIPS